MSKFLAYLFIVFLNFSDAKAEDDKEVYKHLNLFGEAFEKIKNNYVEQVSSKELVEAAIEGMLSSLDPHSTFLNTDELKELKVQTKGEFGGLGIEITMEDGFIKVISPIEDTPAYNAGVQAGDYIIQIDDTPVIGLTISEAVDLMRGEKGSPIIITVSREGLEPFDIEIIRDIIKVQSVKNDVFDNIGYLRITSLTEQTEKGVKKSIKNRQKINKSRKKIRKIVVKIVKKSKKLVNN